MNEYELIIFGGYMFCALASALMVVTEKLDVRWFQEMDNAELFMFMTGVSGTVLIMLLSFF